MAAGNPIASDAAPRPVLGLATIVSVIGIAMTMAGVLSNVIMFHTARLNYADFADISDAVTAGLRYPVAFLFGVSIALFLTLAVWSYLEHTRLRDRITGGIIVAILAVLSIASAGAVMIAAPAGTLLRKDDGFWKSLFLGRSPLVRVEIDPAAGPVKAKLDGAQEVRQLAGGSDYFLFSLDDQVLAVRKDLVRAIEPRNP